MKIIDMSMGTGKTTGLINYMNSNPENKYMFITPFLDEVQRIKGCFRAWIKFLGNLQPKKKMKPLFLLQLKCLGLKKKI